MTSANDDGSGCANLLEIGRALARLIKDGKLPRPRRDIRFWWVNEFASQEQFFRENPGEPRKMLVDINQDMVGARQSWGGRVQYASRLPWSLPHALDDVMESVLDAGARRQHLAAHHARHRPAAAVHARDHGGQGLARAVPRAHGPLLRLDRPPRLHARAQSACPATSLTNWPDEFIHSTGDDLENIDATQLERNAVVVAAVALYFASAGDDEAPALAAYVAARGRARARRRRGHARSRTLARGGPRRARGRVPRGAATWCASRTAKEQAALASRAPPRGARAAPASSSRRRCAGLEGALGGRARRARARLRGDHRAEPAERRPDAKDEQAMADKVFVPRRRTSARSRTRSAQGEAGRRPAPDDALRGATTSPTGAATPTRSTRPSPPRRSRPASGTTAR